MSSIENCVLYNAIKSLNMEASFVPQHKIIDETFKNYNITFIFKENKDTCHTKIINKEQAYSVQFDAFHSEMFDIIVTTLKKIKKGNICFYRNVNLVSINNNEEYLITLLLAFY